MSPAFCILYQVDDNQLLSRVILFDVGSVATASYNGAFLRTLASSKTLQLPQQQPPFSNSLIMLSSSVRTPIRFLIFSLPWAQRTCAAVQNGTGKIKGNPTRYKKGKFIVVWTIAHEVPTRGTEIETPESTQYDTQQICSCPSLVFAIFLPNTIQGQASPTHRSPASCRLSSSQLPEVK